MSTMIPARSLLDHHIISVVIILLVVMEKGLSLGYIGPRGVFVLSRQILH